MARPATRKINYRDGFYIEVSSKMGGSGIKVRRDSPDECKMLAKQYERSKHVKYLGEVKNGKFIDLKK